MVDNSHGKESEVSICLKNYTVKSSISPRKQRVSPMDLLQSLMINAWQCRQFHFGIFLQQNKIRCVFILNTIAASKSGTLPGLGLNHTLWVLSMNLPRPQPDRNISKTMVQHLSKPSPHFLVGESILGKYWKSRKYKGMTNVIKRDVWNFLKQSFHISPSNLANSGIYFVHTSHRFFQFQWHRFVWISQSHWYA